MSDSDSDFGDMDFVSAASTSVKAMWTIQHLNTAAIGVSVNDSITDDSFVSPEKKTADLSSKGRKDETEDKENQRKRDSMNVTPPSSPRQMSNSSGKRGKERAVRGAARTKKTEQALKKILNQQQCAVQNPPANQAPVISPAGRGRARAGRLSRRGSRRSIGKVLILDEEESEDSFEIKVKWKTDVMRIEVKESERIGAVMDRVAERVGLNPGYIGFLEISDTGEECSNYMSRDTTVGQLGLSVVSFILARTRDSVKPDESDLIELKVQTKDRRDAVNIKVKKTDRMEQLMIKFCELKSLEMTTLKFWFDGEELDPTETGESLDLEGGECIDVHQL